MVKNLPANAGDLGSIPGLGWPHEEGNGYPLQYPSLKNLMDRGAWQDTFHGAAKSQTWLSMYACHQWALKGWQNNVWYSVNLIIETSSGDSKDQAGSEDATWNFGGPMVGTHSLQCRGHEFNPWSGNWDPIGPAAQPKKKVAALGNYWTKLTKSKKQSVLDGQVKLRTWMVESTAHYL